MELNFDHRVVVVTGAAQASAKRGSRARKRLVRHRRYDACRTKLQLLPARMRRGHYILFRPSRLARFEHRAPYPNCRRRNSRRDAPAKPTCHPRQSALATKQPLYDALPFRHVAVDFRGIKKDWFEAAAFRLEAWSFGLQARH
jgi:hypothetical protein